MPTCFRYRVQLRALGGIRPGAATVTNEYGYFAFNGIPSSRYTLLVHTENEEVEIDGLSL